MSLYVLCRSSCGRCLGKVEEDGSAERFLLMEKVPQTLAKTGSNMSSIGEPISTTALTVIMQLE